MKRGSLLKKNGKREYKSLIIVLIIIALLILGGILFLVFKSGMTGKVISDFNSGVQSNYNTGDKLNGSIVMTIQSGDLIPNNTLINIKLLKQGNSVASREITFNDFLAGQLTPIEIANSTEVCINMNVDNFSQICENITINNVVENCTLQLNENNETINVCVNETIPYVIENCTDVNNPVIQQSCANQTITNYYFNQAGSYSKQIGGLIDYTFTSSGNYVLRISVESLGINTEKIINVTGERQLGIMATVSITGQVFYLDNGVVMDGQNSSTNSSVNISGSVERPENQTYGSMSSVEESTPPVVILNSPANGASYSGSSYNVLFVFDATDSSGVANCSVYANGVEYVNSTVISEINNNIAASLSAGSYIAYVNCTDALGNIGNSSNIAFTIIAPTGTTTPSYGGGTTALTSNTNKRFYDYTLGNIVRNVNYNLEIPVSQRNLVQISVGNGVTEDHYIELKEISDKTAIIEIRSNPINVTFKIGDEKKFDLNNDMFYDLYVKLNSIKNKKTNLTIKNIHEELSVEDKGKVEENKTYIAEVNNTDQDREQPAGINLLERLKLSWKMFLLFGIIFVIILAIIIFYSVKIVNRINEIKKKNK